VVTVFVYVILTLSVWRLTHLVVEDQIPIVKSPRDWIIARKPHGNVAYLLGCTYCSSVWVAAAHAVAWDLWVDDTSMPVLMLCACAAGWSILTALGETIIDWLDRFEMDS
jgi:hypothetical protein